jgi:hypothetical protein
MATHPIRHPAITRTLPPSWRASRPANMPTANIVIDAGSSIRPDRVMLAPKP